MFLSGLTKDDWRWHWLASLATLLVKKAQLKQVRAFLNAPAGGILVFRYFKSILWGAFSGCTNQMVGWKSFGLWTLMAFSTAPSWRSPDQCCGFHLVVILSLAKHNGKITNRPTEKEREEGDSNRWWEIGPPWEVRMLQRIKQRFNPCYCEFFSWWVCSTSWLWSYSYQGKCKEPNDHWRQATVL